MEVFSKRIKELRNERGISLRALAKDFNTTQQTISRWENNMHEPDYIIIVKYAKYFNVRTDYLLGLED